MYCERDLWLEGSVFLPKSLDVYSVFDDPRDGRSILGLQEVPVVEPAFEVEVFPGHVSPLFCHLGHTEGKLAPGLHLKETLMSKPGTWSQSLGMLYSQPISLTGEASSCLYM